MLKRFVQRRMVEPVLLREALRTATGYSDAERQRVKVSWGAARARASAAFELRSERDSAAALSLLKDAIALAVTALLVARREHDSDTPLSPSEAWQKLGALGLPDAPAREPLESLMASSDVLAPDRLSRAETEALRPTLDGTVRWLLRQTEVRTPRQIKVQRVLRLALVVAAVLLLAAGAAAWALAPPNLARGKPVIASSRWPNSPDPAGLTDGVRGRGYGVHTNLEDKPWVEIDLGETRALADVVVYHRSDGYQEESLPLLLQLSEDHAAWSDAGTRDAVFTDSKPWKIKLAGKRARYLRFMVKRRGYLALSEVEAHGS